MSAGHHVPTVGMCVRVWLALLALTGLTIFIASQDLGMLNTPVALLVAITKASLVIAFFMGVKWNTPLTKTVALSGFVWLIIMFAMSLNDYLTRGWLGVAGR
jgi:cytochrome c oxidase subunit 4